MQFLHSKNHARHTYIIRKQRTVSDTLFLLLMREPRRARLTGFGGYDSLGIGLGMVSRGEVALIVAQKGSMAGLIAGNMFPAVVLMVIVTTLITPLLLKTGMKRPTPGITLL